MAVIWYRCSLPTDTASALVIRHLREQGTLCADHVLRRGGFDVAVVSGDELQALQAAGVAVDDATPLPIQHGGPDGTPPSLDDIATGFVSTYLDTPGVYAAYAALHATFPALCTLTDLPESTTGYDGAAAGLAGPSAVKLFRITTTPGIFTKPAMLVAAGLHAREWVPPLAALEYASELLNNYSPGSADPDVAAVNAIVEQLDTLIVVVANPDGVNYSRHDDAMWRKNRRPNAGAPTCPGVDLNRNFSIYWGQGGSSSSPCDYQVYHGPSAFSEAETRNIRALPELYPNLLTAIDCHSFGENIFRPQPTGGSFIAAEPISAADDAIYDVLETAINAGIASVMPGKSYSTGTTSNHSGTFDEYMFFAHRVFGVELEIGEDFQPPIGDGLVIAREGAAAMQRVATETLGLAARFVTPAAVVQVIDRSGSMVSSGYADGARANAKRIVDLLSLNDTTAVVSFAASATTQLPTTPILSPGDYATARGAVDAISFGGSTSIGAGLERGLTLLPPPGQPRSLLLLSDGYENAAPMVAAVLPTVPADVPVHSVALGPLSDQMLLQHIAAQTGGGYHYAPDELGLFEIYNAIHAAGTDTDMVMNEMLPAAAGTDAMIGETTRRFVIDCDADHVEISVMGADHARLDCTLRCLSLAYCDLSRVRHDRHPGHHVLRWRRPQAGIYELTMRGGALGVAVFVRSPLRFKLVPPEKPGDKAIDWAVRASNRGRPLHDLSINIRALAPGGPLPKGAPSAAGLAALTKARVGDRIPEPALERLANAAAVRARTGIDPLRPAIVAAQIQHAARSKVKDASFGVRVPLPRDPGGSVSLRVDVQGKTATGCAFARTAIASFYIKSS